MATVCTEKRLDDYIGVKALVSVKENHVIIFASFRGLAIFKRGNDKPPYFMSSHCLWLQNAGLLQGNEFTWSKTKISMDTLQGHQVP